MNGWHITVNQMFYITSIKYPQYFGVIPNGVIYTANATKPVDTKFLKLMLPLLYALGKFTWAIHLPMHKKNTMQHISSLSAKNKFTSVIAYMNSLSNFRVPVLKRPHTPLNRYLDDNSTASPYLFAATMWCGIDMKISFVLNSENILITGKQERKYFLRQCKATRLLNKYGR